MGSAGTWLCCVKVGFIHAEMAKLVLACCAGDKDVNTAAEYLKELTIE